MKTMSGEPYSKKPESKPLTDLRAERNQKTIRFKSVSGYERQFPAKLAAMTRPRTLGGGGAAATMVVKITDVRT